jgi:16S rRNA (cytosine1402-N4)-methyltransferase
LHEIETILKKFGEEPFASRIAGAIVDRRRQKEIETTTELAQLVERVVPRRAWPRRLHPATRTFQALRIAVNRELERLEHFLQKAPQFLKPEGRLVVLSYHSLEDRLVKQACVRWEKEGVMRRITKKPVTPPDEEVRQNPRSRSVKMRVAERTSCESA